MADKTGRNLFNTGKFYTLAYIFLLLCTGTLCSVYLSAGTMLTNVSFSCINANSLNMSSANKPMQLKKILGIVKLKTDIIFVSDVRISSRNLISSKEDVASLLRNNQFGSYKPYFNSSRNKRGVAILFNYNLNFAVEEERLDPGEDYILVRAEIQGRKYILGAIYGPNNFDNNFFINLCRDIRSLGNHPIVIGGDWNTTVSHLPVNINPDCFNMQAPPNPRHSELLDELCVELSICDPFRSLHPTSSEFTYVPRRADAESRSRIDFFLISDSLLNYCRDCSIADSLQSSLFDHKAVLLKFSGSGSGRMCNDKVSNKILKDPDVDIIVNLACLESYLFYQDMDPAMKNRILTTLGNCRKDLRDAGPQREFYKFEQDPEIDRQRQLKLNRIGQVLVQEEICNIPNFPVNIDRDIFFDMLLNHVKNELISYQIFIFRFLVKEKRDLVTRLHAAGKNFRNNFLLIQDLEQRLKRISEAEIERALEYHPLYEFLTGEKMSPQFLTLTKGCRSDAKISDICNNDGSPFIQDSDRSSFIKNYFENIYKVPEHMPDNFDNLIENFLGNDIVNHPIVQNCMLSQDERQQLDSPITIQELDVAADQGDVNTAAGADGISNAFVKRFWNFFREPLFDYMTCCFRKKKLTDNFATANIKLIPKKGCKKNIKNWRPISLLTCFYKVISRAVNNRLKKFTDRFCSRAQKGFTSSRQIQEVVININQTIGFCRSENIPAVLVSVDLAKAFDTVWHGYVRASYKFFGVGDTFLDVMDTIGTGRKAQILLDDNSTTPTFDLGTGRPQGDTVSPNQFNTGEQILIFKIELDPEILSVFDALQVPRNNFPVDPEIIPFNFRTESNAETDKADGFADDVSAATIMEERSLTKLKINLGEFGKISGLICNFDKTCVMQFGNTNVDNNFVQDLGFTVVNDITLLGFKINRYGLVVDEMFIKILNTISVIIIKWSRFRLSLPGKINIFKSLLLSQVAYIGSIASPSDGLLNSIQDLMDNFVLGNTRVSKERLYADPEQGGLGLINLKNFLVGLQAAWVKRAYISTRDNWRVDLHSISYGNCYTANFRKIDRIRNPVLHEVVKSFNIFTDTFFKLNDNYKEMFIFRNNSLKRGRDSTLTLDENFFDSNIPRLDLGKVSKLKFKDFFHGNHPKSIDDLTLDTGIPFSLVTYMRIHESLQFFISRNRNRNTDGTQKSIENFLGPLKGVAKKIRKVLDSDCRRKEPGQLQTVKTFFRLTDLTIPQANLSKLLGCWNISHLPNKIRDFIFRFLNNSLPLNTRLSHFVININRQCTFCVINNAQAPSDETFLHLFSSCETTVIIHNWFLNRYFPGTGTALSAEERKKFFFGGGLPGKRYSIFAIVIPLLIQFLIWEMKIQKRTLSPLTLNNDFEFLIKGLASHFDKIFSGLGEFPQNVADRWRWAR
jgi:exonuclease III